MRSLSISCLLGCWLEFALPAPSSGEIHFPVRTANSNGMADGAFIGESAISGKLIIALASQAHGGFSHGFPAGDATGLAPLDRSGFGKQGIPPDPTFPVQGDRGTKPLGAGQLPVRKSAVSVIMIFLSAYRQAFAGRAWRAGRLAWPPSRGCVSASRGAAVFHRAWEAGRGRGN